jgi:pimeloyl-ACP methyl ester carboxylesterase
VQPLFEHRMEFAGFDTRVLELEGDGPGLVLLHGWCDSADTWRPLLAELGARDRRAIAGEIYRQLVFARPRSAEAAVVAAFAAHHASRERVAALLASGRRLLPELQTSPFRFELVRCPVLLIRGTRDRMVPHTGAQILLEALPHTHLELLEDVGHCPQLEATERLLELLLPFPAAVRA